MSLDEKIIDKKRSVAPNAARIRQWRFQKCLTQAQLAKRAKLAKKTIELAENGIPMRPTSLQRIAKALGVSRQELLFEESLEPLEYRIMERLEDRLKGYEVYISRLEKRLKAYEDYQRGEYMRTANGFEAAFFFYESVIELVGEEELGLSALIGIAKVHRKMQKWDKALEVLDTVLNLPDKGETHARAHYTKACYLHLSGHSKEVIFSELRKAIQKVPKATFYRTHALSDPDFESLREHPEFQKAIVGI